MEDNLREPLKIHSGGRQRKSTSVSAKADFPSLPEYENPLATQKQLLEPPLTILVAEDNMGHFILTKRFLENAHLSEDIVHLSDGQVAYDFLNSHCSSFDHKNYILLLDIRMPKIDGVEILEWMKNDPFMKDIPVIVVSAGEDPARIAQCKELGCDEYVVKPLDDSFADKITGVIQHVLAASA